MSTKAKTATEDESEAGEAGAGDGARGDGARGGDAAVTRADVESIVESVVPRIVDELLGDDTDGDGAGDGDGGEGARGGGASSPATVEADIGAAVSRELGRIRSQEQTSELAKTVEGLREKVERAPRKLRRVTRWVWGADDGNE